MHTDEPHFIADSCFFKAIYGFFPTPPQKHVSICIE
nr:MAG TPA: hypothetical protein [Caudoviricetes sp.]